MSVGTIESAVRQVLWDSGLAEKSRKSLKPLHAKMTFLPKQKSNSSPLLEFAESFLPSKDRNNITLYVSAVSLNLCCLDPVCFHLKNKIKQK